MKSRFPHRVLAIGGALALLGLLLWLGRPPGSVPKAGPPTPPRAMARADPARSPGEAAVDPAGRPAVVSPRALFAYAPRPAEAAAVEAQLAAPADRVYYVRLNRELIEGKQSPFWQAGGGGRFELPLPDGRSLPVVIAATELLGANRFTSEGRIEGRPGSRAIFGYNEGVLHAMIEDLDLGMFTLRYGNGDVSQFFHVDESKIPPCGGDRTVPLDYVSLREIARHKLQATAPRPATAADAVAVEAGGPAGLVAADSAPPRATVDVMMLATRAVLDSLVGGNDAAKLAALQSAFDTAIAKVNSDFAASLIAARVRLVRADVVDYNEQTSTAANVQDDALTALRNGTITNVNSGRDRYGADLVCLALGRADTGSSGIAFIMSKPSLYDTGNWTANPGVGYSVVQYGLINSSRVVSHELGHNFGCAHAHGDDGSKGIKDGGYEFSYGYRFTDNRGRRWRTMMAYDLPPPNPSYAEISYFSNPRLDPTDLATGQSLFGVPVGGVVPPYVATDNAQTITLDAFEVATFRPVADRLYGQGTMINVSTRAWVGTGAESLIGGFVIQGTQNQTVLIRGVGPSLAQFGVTGVLADPQLSLHQQSDLAEIAKNDNWGVGDYSPAAAIAATSFAPRDAREAALLVTLPPGAYTAIVSDKNGGTGNGMVEVYETGSSASRLVNLSTRGYSGAGDKTMIGGFVVTGPAGTTKRVLLRGLGPSLARFGLTNAMDDPMLELYNAQGQLLLKQDDFSGGVTGRSDDNPLVTTYAQQQIVATGFAPPNRREPCVMLDLEPGAYTVMLKPFEALDRATPQVAQPGVGLIEVYEIPDK